MAMSVKEPGTSQRSESWLMVNCEEARRKTAALRLGVFDREEPDPLNCDRSDHVLGTSHGRLVVAVQT